MKQFPGIGSGYCDFEVQALENAKNAIIKAEKIALLAHSGADADTLTSCLAWSWLLDKMGKTTEVICPDQPKAYVRQGHKTPVVAKHSFVPDLLIACDAAVSERIYLPEAFQGISLVNIDHHIANPLYGTWNFLEAKASSAAEVVAVVMHAMFGVEVFDQKLSEILLQGILDDSNTFRTSSCGVDSLAVACFLMREGGADFQKVKNEVQKILPPSQLARWGEMLCGIESLLHDKLGMLKLSYAYMKRRGITQETLQGFINFAASHSSFQVFCLLYEPASGAVKGSFRSKGFDVNRIAGELKGGGHVRAAGFMVQNDTIENVANWVIRRLKQEL